MQPNIQGNQEQSDFSNQLDQPGRPAVGDETLARMQADGARAVSIDGVGASAASAESTEKQPSDTPSLSSPVLGLGTGLDRTVPTTTTTTLPRKEDREPTPPPPKSGF